MGDRAFEWGFDLRSRNPQKSWGFVDMGNRQKLGGSDVFWRWAGVIDYFYPPSRCVLPESSIISTPHTSVNDGTVLIPAALHRLRFVVLPLVTQEEQRLRARLVIQAAPDIPVSADGAEGEPPACHMLGFPSAPIVNPAF